MQVDCNTSLTICLFSFSHSRGNQRQDIFLTLVETRYPAAVSHFRSNFAANASYMVWYDQSYGVEGLRMDAINERLQAHEYRIVPSSETGIITC